MKKLVLSVSAVSILLAALLAIVVTTFATDPTILAKALACSGYLGLLSVGTFFVGLASPKE